MSRTLPKWTDEMSDGCSVPWGIRLLTSISLDGIRAVCVRHDEKYYYGGGKADRLRADLEAALGWLAAGMPVDEVERWYTAVRWMGAPNMKRPNVSWAFGGARFQYDTAPATPEEVKET